MQEIIKEKVKKFLYQSGVEIVETGKEERKLFKELYGKDKLYRVWDCSLVRFAERITQEERKNEREWIATLLKENLSREDYGRIIKELYLNQPKK